VTLNETLNAVAPADEKETADLRVMREFAVSLAEPFSRKQWPTHFTGSAVVVTPDGLRVCLLHHAKLNRWLQPGGHADAVDGGDMAQTALREAREETGLEIELVSHTPLDVDVHVIPARKDEPEHRHLDVRYLVIAKNPDALAHDPNEAHGAQWLTWEEALSRADEAPLKRMLSKAFTKVRTHHGLV
jgi:8-oxo-dGTP pyrophosphatase MutT (NUDIX family)